MSELEFKAMTIHAIIDGIAKNEASKAFKTKLKADVRRKVEKSKKKLITKFQNSVPDNS